MEKESNYLVLKVKEITKDTEDFISFIVLIKNEIFIPEENNIINIFE